MVTAPLTAPPGSWQPLTAGTPPGQTNPSGPTNTPPPPPNGEALLPDLGTTDWATYVAQNTSGPTPGWEGGGVHSQDFQAQIDFKNMFGRNPTASELAMLAPAYASADPNHGNPGGGKAQVAAYYQQQTNTPQNIYNQQQQQYLTNAPKFADQVTQTFQSQLGRAPTQDELTHFGALMASGQDQYQVQQALQQTQEYQNTQNTNFQNQLQAQLQGSNSTYFNQYILPSIQAQNAQAGRTQDSSGYQSQLANAALQQNQGLQNFLAGVTAQNYQNSTANATNQYNQLMSQQYGLQNANVSSGLANQAANQQYNQNLNMYQLQQQAYNNYLNQYGKRNGLINDIRTGLNFANAAMNLGRGGANAFGSGSSSGGAGSGFSSGPSQGSNYYNGYNNNPANYKI